MKPIYEYISKEVDQYYFKGRIERACAFYLVESFNVRDKFIKLRGSKDKHLYFTSHANDQKISKEIKSISEGKEQIELKDMDKLARKFRDSHPVYMNSCFLEMLKSCKKNQDIACLENKSRLFYLSYIKNSWIFEKMTNETQASINEEVKHLETIRKP